MPNTYHHPILIHGGLGIGSVITDIEIMDHENYPVCGDQVLIQSEDGIGFLSTGIIIGVDLTSNTYDLKIGFS